MCLKRDLILCHKSAAGDYKIYDAHLFCVFISETVLREYESKYHVHTYDLQYSLTPRVIMLQMEHSDSSNELAEVYVTVISIIMFPSSIGIKVTKTDLLIQQKIFSLPLGIKLFLTCTLLYTEEKMYIVPIRGALFCKMMNVFCFS